MLAVGGEISALVTTALRPAEALDGALAERAHLPFRALVAARAAVRAGELEVDTRLAAQGRARPALEGRIASGAGMASRTTGVADRRSAASRDREEQGRHPSNAGDAVT